MIFRKQVILVSIGIVFLSCNKDKKLQPESVKKPEVSTITFPVWEKSIPDSELVTGTETYNDGMISNVSNPAITIFSPAKNNTGVAIIVFPGGGYNKLAIELEGSEICKWLSSIGITGVLLKYRVPASGPHYDKDCNCEKDPIKPLALQDAQRALGLIRYQAKELKINPNKIGVMGFSAGGHLVADISNHYKKRAYTIADNADKISCRPDFALAFYPGHMRFHTDKPYELNRTISVDSKTPPTFILHAGNDSINSVENSLVYYMALQKAGVPAEFHIYEEGGHAFGLNQSAQKIPNWSELPIADWEKLVERWLRTIKMTSH
ncbi:alpha/beta hydrolase [Chryseobacterium chendengshani]|uniref:alpha/beta hydrolase n=1 Tax=unclassified Chryseobacterium TaxID=2593645 RepID=UPI001C641B25|nr:MULTISPECIES: alpha/beta hydrolase [unclassified Chryseobacterium]MBW7676680.1 alpha/beta hydrolase [Chryseobacterium sp. LJ756]MBW8523224.1 alpha/beta hydrolase [Chryseobacterium sp. LJ668]QYK15517.1 alpha/beta hydrolase [Chryseobacterium sp. LJ668]